MKKKPLRKIIEQEEEGNFTKDQIKEAVEKSSKLKETIEKEKSNVLIPFTKFPEEFDVSLTRYVKKPIPVRAIMMAQRFKVETLEGTMTGKNGDYLVEGVDGEVYPCDKSIFERTYTKYKGKEKKNDYNSYGRGMLIGMLSIGALLYAIACNSIPVFVIFMIVVLIVAELILRYQYKREEEKRKNGNKSR